MSPSNMHVSHYDLAGESLREGEAPPGYAGGGGDVSAYDLATNGSARGRLAELCSGRGRREPL